MAGGDTGVSHVPLVPDPGQPTSAPAPATGMGITQATFNGREAAQIPDTSGACIIALELTESSRVDVGVSGIDTDEACELVERVTEIVEPKLPEAPR